MNSLPLAHTYSIANSSCVHFLFFIILTCLGVVNEAHWPPLWGGVYTVANNLPAKSQYASLSQSNIFGSLLLLFCCSLLSSISNVLSLSLSLSLSLRRSGPFFVSFSHQCSMGRIYTCAAPPMVRMLLEHLTAIIIDNTTMKSWFKIFVFFANVPLSYYFYRVLLTQGGQVFWSQDQCWGRLQLQILSLRSTLLLTVRLKATLQRFVLFVCVVLELSMNKHTRTRTLYWTCVTHIQGHFFICTHIYRCYFGVAQKSC